ncbi:hypothetical protein CBM2592_B40152 [Cupriavidus taiwanensis]|nr:hypothetical protein CBM2592_B40152 [Cupriavidus taiwanensis]SOY70745.1 hypothetical protein CBM2588_B30151 [Cupriavidus taiwanensis]SOY95578.1 hypothetical protein CBM2591_B20149 [Cupriavidus taiwanensis]SOZ29771.1 hypothetical protein CBM2608_B30175 [Cupriavidus taiwanensis]SOZ74585.1 hypothetical protein CBM2617_B60062 [Cupriavidus taiwanensis]
MTIRLPDFYTRSRRVAIDVSRHDLGDSLYPVCSVEACACAQLRSLLGKRSPVEKT